MAENYWRPMVLCAFILAQKVVRRRASAHMCVRARARVCSVCENYWRPVVLCAFILAQKVVGHHARVVCARARVVQPVAVPRCMPDRVTTNRMTPNPVE